MTSIKVIGKAEKAKSLIIRYNKPFENGILRNELKKKGITEIGMYYDHDRIIFEMVLEQTMEEKKIKSIKNNIVYNLKRDGLTEKRDYEVIIT